jgi:hypothetical protein
VAVTLRPDFLQSDIPLGHGFPQHLESGEEASGKRRFPCGDSFEGRGGQRVHSFQEKLPERRTPLGKLVDRGEGERFRIA